MEPFGPNGTRPSDSGDGPEPRRRKLDELFADEPFLSTTMKARRLHEKLREAQTGRLNGAQTGAQGPAEAPPLPEQPTEPVAPPLRIVRDSDPAPVLDFGYCEQVPFEDAAAFLRDSRSQTPRVRLAPAAEARLLAFRDRTLAAWLRESGLG